MRDADANRSYEFPSRRFRLLTSWRSHRCTLPHSLPKINPKTIQMAIRPRTRPRLILPERRPDKALNHRLQIRQAPIKTNHLRRQTRLRHQPRLLQESPQHNYKSLTPIQTSHRRLANLIKPWPWLLRCSIWPGLEKSGYRCHKVC